MCSAWTLPETQAVGIFLAASSQGHDQLLTPFPAPLPPLEQWGRGRGEVENSKLQTAACPPGDQPHPGARSELPRALVT